MRTIIVLCLAALAGCINKGVDLKTPFNPQEASYILQPGEGSIKGRAAVTQNGQVLIAIGQEVQLIPITAYAIERMQAIYGNSNIQRENINIIFTNPDPNYEAYKRRTRADFQGNFEFNNVPDGNYYVATAVLKGGGSTDFIAIRKRVSVIGGNEQMVLIDGT